MRLPAFWAGALASRDETDVSARRRLLTIREAVEHTPLSAIPEFGVWLAHDKAMQPSAKGRAA